MIFAPVKAGKELTVNILVDNLNKMGVSASSGESATSLIRKVLDIPQGDTRQEIFEGNMINGFDVSCGYFTTNETCQLAGVLNIDYWNKVSSIVISIDATGDSTADDVKTLNITTDGWTVAETATGYKLTKDSTQLSKFGALDSVGTITITGDGATCVTTTITASVVMSSGSSVTADGSTPLTFTYGATWASFEEKGYTWEALEAMNATWETLAAMNSRPST